MSIHVGRDIYLALCNGVRETRPGALCVLCSAALGVDSSGREEIDLMTRAAPLPIRPNRTTRPT